jgi:type I restriction enzyme M protein
MNCPDGYTAGGMDEGAENRDPSQGLRASTVNHSEIVSFLWGVADLIRDTFKRGKYQDVILPLTVLRRLDCVLAGTKKKVLAKQAELRDKKLENLDPQLRKVAGFVFYNTSRYDFEKLLADAPHLAANLRNYIAGFSANMREVLEKFDFDNTISKLDEAGLLFQVLERFKNVELPPCQYRVRHLPWAIKSTKVGPAHDPIDEDFHDREL